MAKKIVARIKELETAFLEAVENAKVRWCGNFSVPKGVLEAFVLAVTNHANGESHDKHQSELEHLIREVLKHQRNFFLKEASRLREHVKTCNLYDTERRSVIDRLLGTLDQFDSKEGGEQRFASDIDTAVRTFLAARDVITPLVAEQKRLNDERRRAEAAKWRQDRLSDAASYASRLGISLEKPIVEHAVI